MDLAGAAGLSQSAVSRVELGAIDGLTVGTLDDLATALGGRLEVRLFWRGEELDRLVDAAHASMVECVVALFVDGGWDVVTEASFSVYGERGSIDVFARHIGIRRLAVVEVKASLADVQATLATLDRKVRNAPVVARERGWDAWPVSRILVVRSSSTARRRISQHEATFRSVFPTRGRAVLRWLRSPVDESIAGLVFLAATRDMGVNKRVRRAGPPQSRSLGA